jgi:hypothetical protein
MGFMFIAKLPVLKTQAKAKSSPRVLCEIAQPFGREVTLTLVASSKPCSHHGAANGSAFTGAAEQKDRQTTRKGETRDTESAYRTLTVLVKIPPQEYSPVMMLSSF